MTRKEQEVTVDGKKVTVYVTKPSNEIISNADMYRAKIWNKCIRDEIITKKELKVLMEERGIWDKSKSDKEDEIGKQIGDLEKTLYRGKGGKKPKVSEGKELAVKMRDLRASLRELIAERLSLEENTAEALSDNARFDYFVANCTFFKDSEKRVYNSVEDYSSKSSDEIAFAAASLLGNILYNLDSDFEKNLPENRWLNMFELTDEKGNFVNQEGQRVDVEGNTINDLGHYLDEGGKRVDIDGNPLDEDGHYLLVDYENDLTKPKRKTRPRKKTPAKTEATES
tara:strand:+ start:5217 stop:6065 length:849 start_codon:yes stop_codon:yes gene_type:complete